MFLLVGLGNPGPEYAANRHNIGYMALDEIVRSHSFEPWRRRFHGSAAEGRIGESRALALKPETYMNLSGQAVAAALSYYRLEADQVIALHYDLDLAPGKLRVKQGGGNAGHNGLRSLDSHIGRDYRRVRFGIGHPGERGEVEDYVLHDVAKADRGELEASIEAVAEHIGVLVQGDMAGFMNNVALQTGAGR